MPQYNANVLPASGGLSLGQPLQRWNASLGIVSATALTVSPVTGFTTPLSGILNVNANPVTANANTTGDQNLMSFTIPAGLLNSLNRVLRFRLGGSFTTQVSQTPFFAIRLRIGGTQITSPFTATLAAGSTNWRWSAMMDLIVAQAGTSAFIEPLSLLTYGNFQVSVADGQALARVGPFDTTTDLVAQIQCSFSTNTSPANIIIQRSMIAEILN